MSTLMVDPDEAYVYPVKSQQKNASTEDKVFSCVQKHRPASLLAQSSRARCCTHNTTYGTAKECGIVYSSLFHKFKKHPHYIRENGYSRPRPAQQGNESSSPQESILFSRFLPSVLSTTSSIFVFHPTGEWSALSLGDNSGKNWWEDAEYQAWRTPAA